MSESNSEEIIEDERNDSDYSSCFESGIPISVFRLVYSLQYSELKKRINHPDKTCTITFILSPNDIEILTDTLLWEIRSSTINRTNNLVTIRVPESSIILQGLDHKNPSFPREIFEYLEIRARKEMVDIRL